MNSPDGVMRRWLRLAGRWLVFGIVGLSAGAEAAIAKDELGRRARAALFEVLEREEKFIKVHAAEVLIAHGEATRVREEFQRELAHSGDVPAYRVGIWRVLAGAAATPAERDRWVGRIVAVFLDEAAPDRLVAIESLAKLGRKLDGAALRAAREFTKRTEAETVFAWWALHLAGEKDALPRLRELLGSTEPISRLRAAYAMRWENCRDAASRAALARAADQEPRETIGYAIILAAAVALEADASDGARWQAAIDDILTRGGPVDRYQVCLALQRRFTATDLKTIEPLLTHQHGDARVGAAAVMLQLAEPKVVRM